MASGIEFEFAHASLDTFNTDQQNYDDIKRLIKKHLLYYALTETGQRSAFAVVKDVVKNETDDYIAINPDGGDVAFIVRLDVRLKDFGGLQAVPRNPKPVKDGGHGPRFNSFFTGSYRGEMIGHVGCHFVTKDANHSQPGGVDRSELQLKQADMMGKMIVELGKGHKLALGSGDINSSLPENRDMQKIFDTYGLTTTAEETNVASPTHGPHRIDYAWTYDEDKRLSVPTMKVLKDENFESDHNPLRVKVAVAPRRSA